jgi:UPF0042 nucleotide-binding protein
MEFLIITGLSGAGKSQTAGILEDLGYYCVDNMPAELIPRFAELCLAAEGAYNKVALVSDIRGNKSFDGLFLALEKMEEMGCKVRILFIEASNSVIIKRYKETRRRHPLDWDGSSIESAINEERALLKDLRERADYVIDTTDYPLAALQRTLSDYFVENKNEKPLNVNLMSFGYRNGLPNDADLIFDVRFLPNPYYVPELKQLTGRDQAVKDYIFSFEQTKTFVNMLRQLIEFLLPLYTDEGKPSLKIAFGCTGGRHRSVALAEHFYDLIRQMGYKCTCSHREIS